MKRASSTRVNDDVICLDDSSSGSENRKGHERTDTWKKQSPEQKHPRTATHGFAPPPVFHLLRLDGVPNDYSVSLSEIIEPGAELAVVMDYMIDCSWLFSSCPNLEALTHRVVLIHGNPPELDEANGFALRQLGVHDRVRMVRPPLPLRYGVHHTKMILLFYANRGARVCVHTANMIRQDWEHKSQAAWIRDFPPKNDTDTVKSDFEADLVEYISRLGCDQVIEEVIDRVKQYNFSRAGATLIASVPGTHSAREAKWGHLKLRKVLRRERFIGSGVSTVVCQFSSLGAVQEPWLDKEWHETVFSRADRSIGSSSPENIKLVFPTVRDVAGSREGWDAGNSLPVRKQNIMRPCVARKLCRFSASQSGRQQAMPHMKTYLRYRDSNPDHIQWVLLTSANLSMAAWGRLQSNASVLKVLSYEVGVLLLPSNYSRPTFSLGEPVLVCPLFPTGRPTQLRPAWVPSESSLESSNLQAEYSEMVPLPYELPPPVYRTGVDIPWHIDGSFTIEHYPPYHGI